MDVERHRLQYPDVHALMRELQRIGARNAARDRSRGLTGRSRLQRMVAAYETRRTVTGLPATFEVIFGAAFGAASGADAAAAGEHLVPLTALKRMEPMSQGIFIAGTDTDVGKTRVTLALLRCLQSRGIHATGMKPVATGTRPVTAAELPIFAGFCAVGDLINDDVVAIAALSPPECDRLDVNPYCFDWGVSPHIAAGRAGVRIEPERVAAAYERLATRCDAVVVEGTGGWFAPIGECGTMADIAQRLALPVVLTVGLRLGCLNHALLSAQAIGVSNLRLAGWIGSVLKADMPALDENLAALDALLGVPRLALLPYSVATDGDAEHVSAAVARLFDQPARSHRRG